MILETLFGPIFSGLQGILSIIPQIPDFPEELTNAIDNFFNLLFSNSGLVGFFVPMNLILIALPLALAIINFERIYNFIIWIVKKLPFFAID